MEYKLSYVITTRNKLPYLKEVVNRLLDHVQEDEEIIVVDGASTDDTVAYLEQLYEQGLIDHFITDADHGEAHGYNKGFMVARGTLIKVITDDDVFFYDGIRKCKNFMLEHSEIDVLGTEGAGTSLGLDSPYVISNYRNDYLKWKNMKLPFEFSGLGLMIRRKSLSYIGLFNTGNIWVDMEYTLRVSSLKKVHLAWYTGCCWVRIANPQSNAVVFNKEILEEQELLEYIYLKKNHIINRLGFLYNKGINSFKRSIKNILKTSNINFSLKEHNCEDWSKSYDRAEMWLIKMNEDRSREDVFEYKNVGD